jgi:DedD protein
MEEKLKQMRQKTNDLSDIVLEKDSKKTENTKKWLLTAASMILLFLIILIIMKMLNKPESAMNEEIAQVGESVETLVPDDMQETPTQATENLFKKEPIIDETSETDLKFEEMVRKLKEQDRVEEPTVEKLPEVKEEVVAVKETKEEKPQTVKEVKPQEIKPVVQVVPEEIVAPVAKPAPKKKVAQKIAPLYPKETKIPSISGYFIQVGATAKSFPDKRFLQKIKRAGFDYIVHGVTVKGKHIKKVLVGPYSTRTGAKNALAAVKANINPSAYIYRIK